MVGRMSAEKRLVNDVVVKACHDIRKAVHDGLAEEDTEEYQMNAIIKGYHILVQVKKIQVIKAK